MNALAHHNHAVQCSAYEKLVEHSAINPRYPTLQAFTLQTYEGWVGGGMRGSGTLGGGGGGGINRKLLQVLNIVD